MSKVMVVANETVAAQELLAELRRIEDERSSEYLVVVPAHPLDQRHTAVWSQEGAIEAAQARLDQTLAILADEGLQATGTIGDLRPIYAIKDALMDFPADLMIISTHPEEHSTWWHKSVVDQARKKFGVPVVHVVSRSVAAQSA